MKDEFAPVTPGEMLKEEFLSEARDLMKFVGQKAANVFVRREVVIELHTPGVAELRTGKNLYQDVIKYFKY